MNLRSGKRPNSRRIACIGVLVAWTAAAGCSGGQNVTTENIEAARRLWTKAGIRDYELEYTTAPAHGHFLVTVRGGEVKKVEGVQPGGARNELHPGAPRYYSIDGIFTTIADELAKLKEANPFDEPKGTTIVMKFKTNPELGYPEWYRRDIMGTNRSARIDIVKLTRTPAALKPEKD
jgi:Family of unknown function (DUF6174)